jgi:ADP-ribose pyrophosphatase YjhB (NUDIX family)
MTEARLAGLPKKIMAAARDHPGHSQQLLMVRTTYRIYWALPSGVVEQGIPLVLAV